VQARSQKWIDRNNRVVDNAAALKDWQPDEGWDFDPKVDWKPDVQKYDGDIGKELSKVVDLAKQKTSASPSSFVVLQRERETIAQYVESIAKAQPERFARGYVGVEIKERKELNAFAATDGNGTIYFASEDAQLLASAIKKLQTRQGLTFEEEQAFATLEHEILHNEAALYRYLRPDTAQCNVMEVVNEITARSEYSRHIQARGFKEEHKEEIRRSGNGYPILVKNFDRLVEQLTIPMPYKELKTILLTKDYSSHLQEVASILEQSSSVPKEKIRALLTILDKEEFEQRLQEIIPKR
jgi:hypothetical protein